MLLPYYRQHKKSTHTYTDLLNVWSKWDGTPSFRSPGAMAPVALTLTRPCPWYNCDMLYLKSYYVQVELFTHIIKIFIKVWAVQKYLIQELAHQCGVRSSLSDKISSAFGSNLVVPVIKIDFKCSCENEVWYLDHITYFSKLRHSKEVVKRFMVGVFRTLTFQEMVKRILVAVQITYAFLHHI
jgi:hypothetical protein